MAGIFVDGWESAMESLGRKMKVVILAGGKGTRISEESRLRPKPMVEIGDKPILWHIMKRYAFFGLREFVVCCGYKGHMIKEYFVNYYQQNSQIQLCLDRDGVQVMEKSSEPWKVTLVDTGLNTKTAGRILRAREYIGDAPFFLTYGDGLADVDIQKLLCFHRRQGRAATISVMQPQGRFGALMLEEGSGRVLGFREKARADQAWVNIGFMVMEPEVYPYLGAGEDMLEGLPFEQLASDGQMAAYRHKGFWHPMDNVHDREYLGGLWDSGAAPWEKGVP